MSTTGDKKNQRYVHLADMMLLAAALACNRTVPTATPAPSTAVPVAATDTVTPIPDATAAATASPPATPPVSFLPAPARPSLVGAQHPERRRLDPLPSRRPDPLASRRCHRPAG